MNRSEYDKVDAAEPEASCRDYVESARGEFVRNILDWLTPIELRKYVQAIKDGRLVNTYYDIDRETGIVHGCIYGLAVITRYRSKIADIQREDGYNDAFNFVYRGCEWLKVGADAERATRLTLLEQVFMDWPERTVQMILEECQKRLEQYERENNRD